MEQIFRTLVSATETADDTCMRSFFRRVTQVLGPVLTAVGGLTDLLPGALKPIAVVAGTIASLFVSPPGKKP